MAFLFEVFVIISLLSGGLSLIRFLRISLKLGLEEVDPVGANGDDLLDLADLGEALDLVDLVLDGVGGPEVAPDVVVFGEVELLVTLVLV